MLEFYLFQLICLLIAIIGLLFVNRYSTQSMFDRTSIKVFIVLIGIGIIPFLGFASVFDSFVNIGTSTFKSNGKFGEWLNSVPFRKKD